jgi:hypothetical protein
MHLPLLLLRAEILVDIVHPGNYGSDIYAAFLAWNIRHQVRRIPF